MRTLSSNPSDRLGVYKRLGAVPDEHRLHSYADAYAQRDAWAEYVEGTALYERYDSDRYRADTRRAVHRWKEHTANRGHHHALATPADVNTWCAALATDLAISTVYNLYWTRIAEFYDWLRWHVAHPHRYDPVLMAANEYRDDVAGEVWTAKITHSINGS